MHLSPKKGQTDDGLLEKEQLSHLLGLESIHQNQVVGNYSFLIMLNERLMNYIWLT